jgi:hypothetical protein
LFATLERLRRLLGPFISLASGIVSVVLLRRGLDFAPVAAACVLVAWTLVIVVSRWLPQRRRETRVHKAARWIARYVISALYQDVLFFLLPVWFGSATWPSPNVIGPLVLTLLAVFSCFDQSYRSLVLERPILRTMVSALILFATLLAATPILFATSLLPNVAVSAAVSMMLVAIAVLPDHLLRSGRGFFAVMVLSGVAASIALPIARFLPPVPVQCMRAETALEIRAREPYRPERVFEGRPERVYAWFAVAAPKHFSQAILFRFIHDGHPLGKEFETNISGGRATGFRTWGAIKDPAPGHWTVELYADSEQLIARQTFRVLSSTAAIPR